jgi:hypothetical protein
LKQERIAVEINWEHLPEGAQTGTLTIQQSHGASVKVHVQALRPVEPKRNAVEGFIEANHVVAIEAEHFTANRAAGGVQWERIPGFGETLSGMSVFPVTAASVEKLDAPAATLEYRMYLFEGGKFNVEAILAPSLNFVPGRGLRFAISFDDQPPVVLDALEHHSDKDWAQAVSDGVRKAQATLTVDGAGYHTLKFRMVDPGVVLEKLVVSQGRLPVSYLGPPESYFHLTPEK